MATVTEQFQSRTGGGRGTDGIEPPARLFRVRLDTLTQDPVSVVHGLEGTPSVFVPLYSPYPHAHTAAYASGGIVRERSSALTYVVEVPYRWVSPAVYQDWRAAFRFGIETEHIKTTVTNPRKVIGPYVYRYIPVGPGQFWTRGVDGEQIWLERSDMRRPIGYDRTKGVCTFTMNKEVPFLNLQLVGPALASSCSKVNSDIFFGAAAGQIKLVGANIDHVVGSSPNTPVSPDGTYWTVGLEFLWNGDKHSPYGAIHTVTDELGNEGIVYHVGESPAGDPVTEDFDVYESISMAALLSIFQ